MDSIIAAATAETKADIERWAEAIWNGERPDMGDFDRRLVLAMVAGAMGGVSTEEMADMVGDPGPDRHLQRTEEIFRGMVEAIAKKKPTLGSLDPKSLSERMKQTAFFVSGVAKGNVLDRIHQRLLEARVRGLPRSWFIAQVRHEADLSESHLETVFRTNVESAVGAARWKQANDPDVADLVLGFEYFNPRDERSRPLHAAMSGFVAVKSDPIWKVIWTPNGFRCRCRCRPILWDRGEQYGLLDSKGRTKADRVFKSDLQRQVIQSIESGTAVVVGRRRLRFPDEGFRGNALMDIV